MRRDQGTLWVLGVTGALAGLALTGKGSPNRHQRARVVYALQKMVRAYGPWWRSRRPVPAMELTDQQHEAMTEIVRLRAEGQTPNDLRRSSKERAVDDQWREVVRRIGRDRAGTLLRDALDVYVDDGKEASLDYLFMEYAQAPDPR